MFSFLPIVHALQQSADCEMTVRDERPHSGLVGQRDRPAILRHGVPAVVALDGNVAEETEGGRLKPAAAALQRLIQKDKRFSRMLRKDYAAARTEAVRGNTCLMFAVRQKARSSFKRGNAVSSAG